MYSVGQDKMILNRNFNRLMHHHLILIHIHMAGEEKQGQAARPRGCTQQEFG